MSGESEVLQALQLACSQDPAVMKVGEKQLDSWKTEKNFYATLAVRELTFRPVDIVHFLSLSLSLTGRVW